jgi:uncharacterized RDD family membrane protein YckC
MAAQRSVLLPTGHKPYAGFWRRLLAYLIDIFLLCVLFFLVGSVVAVVAPNAPESFTGALFNLVGILVFWVYYANCESGPHQATLGKRALRLHVTDENGQRLTFGRASGRFFGKFLSGLMLGLGFLAIGFTSKKQGLHDKLASTLVLCSAE